MTEAQACIADLDAALAECGENVVLQRLVTDDAGVQFAAYQVDPCRANVRSSQPQDLEAPNTLVILSPTDLTRALFPGLPERGDRIIIAGRANTVEIVTPFSVGGILVRIEIMCREYQLS